MQRVIALLSLSLVTGRYFSKDQLEVHLKKNNFLNRCANVNGKDILIKNI